MMSRAPAECGVPSSPLLAAASLLRWDAFSFFFSFPVSLFVGVRCYCLWRCAQHSATTDQAPQHGPPR